MSEQHEAEALATRLKYAGLAFTHIPNETGGTPEAFRRAIRMKRAGTSPGFPDYIILKDGTYYFIELKTKTGKATPTQRAWLETLAKMPNTICAVCHGCDEAVELLGLDQKQVNRKDTYISTY